MKEERQNTMKLFYLAAITLLMLTDLGWGQAKRPRTLDELVSYTGADRQQIILDGARRKGSSFGIRRYPAITKRLSKLSKRSIRKSP